MPADPVARTMLLCEQNANQPCELYAVNGSVVWVKPPREIACRAKCSGCGRSHYNGKVSTESDCAWLGNRS